MLKKRLSSDIIFSELFKNNPPQRILAFLDEETNYWEDIKVMQSVPSLPFIAAIFDEIELKLKN